MFVEANGIKLWYEKKGEGTPLVILHGNGESGKFFKAFSEALSLYFTVYLLDSRCHGKSEKGSLSYEIMAEDVKAFISELNLEKPVLYGFSDGGIIGLILASRYPSLLSKLIVAGANTKPSTLKRGWLILIKSVYFFIRSPLLKLMLTEPNITAEDLQKIESPTVVLAGEKDLIKQEDAEFIAGNIKNSELNIFKGENHLSYVRNFDKLFKYFQR